MHSLQQMFTMLAPSLANAWLASLWTGLALTGTVALTLRATDGMSSTVRSYLLAVAMLSILALTAFLLLAPQPEASTQRIWHVGQTWSQGLLTVWLTVSVLRGASLILGAGRLYRLSRRARPVEVNATLAALLARSRRSTTLCESAEVRRPYLMGYLRPRILLPAGLLEHLSETDVQHLVLHEVEHLRRGDDWLQLLQQISLALLPMHPALLWFHHRLCRERELACDDEVLRFTNAPRAYAACLVKLSEDSLLRRGMTLALSVLGTEPLESELGRRVRRILDGRKKHRATGFRRFVSGIPVVAAAVVTILLVRSPSLVTFDRTERPGFLTAASTPEAALGPNVGLVRPAEMQVSAGAFRPVTVNAVLEARTARSVSAVNVARKRARKGSVRFRAASMSSAPRQVVPVLLTDPLPTPVRLRSGHVLATAFDFSQPVYAAVPWQDGWLIVQL